MLTETNRKGELESSSTKLRLIPIKSVSTPFPVIQPKDILNLIRDHFKDSTAFCFLYSDNEVRVAQWKSSTFVFPEGGDLNAQYIQRFRCFNPTQELLLWRGSSGFSGRLRKDGEGTLSYAVEACQVLWGTPERENSKGYTVLRETRGPRLAIPGSFGSSVNPKTPLMLKTRNYVDIIGETGQATYGDCRFVDLVVNGKSIAFPDLKSGKRSLP